MNYRTDLAVEADELWRTRNVRTKRERRGAVRAESGRLHQKTEAPTGYRSIEIEISTEKGVPRGTYVTIEIQGLFEEKENIGNERRAVAAELKN